MFFLKNLSSLSKKIQTMSEQLSHTDFFKQNVENSNLNYICKTSQYNEFIDID